MKLEIDISVLDLVEDITLNQLVFLNLVLNDHNQISIKQSRKLLSLVEETQIQDLINRNLITVDIVDGNTIYSKTEYLQTLLGDSSTWFDEFFNTYPAVVVRTDGLRDFLRKNKNKCRKYYNQIVGKSYGTHRHIMDCLHYELQDRMLTNKLSYQKSMWKWLTNCEWEAYEEQLKTQDSPEIGVMYGTDII